MLYHIYEMNHAVLAPWRAMADTAHDFWQSPANPLAKTYIGRSMTASLELFERMTRRYGKPAFSITETVIDGLSIPVSEIPALKKPFCTLLHFNKEWTTNAPPKRQEKLLLVAPMSGHYATLLRGTVEAMLPHADVYITDWQDARHVPVTAGAFDLDDYIDYVIEMLRFLGPGTNVMAVCQPSVPVLAAVSHMSAIDDPYVPKSMVLMGGPIDTRRNPTVVNTLAVRRGTDWFRNNVIVKVPFPHEGAFRDVYPGFMQLTGFMTMNLDRHIDAHRELFWHLVEGDGDSAEKHREFYDEYMSVMDLTAEFYLQTVDVVFQRHLLPKGEMLHRGRPVDLGAIEDIAILAIEGERDDISGIGQTKAALTLAKSLPAAKKKYLMAKAVGHYGIFNGRKWRDEIAPVVEKWIRANGG